MLYETSNFHKVWNNFKTTSLWKNLNTIPSYNLIQNSINKLDTISGKKDNVKNLFVNRQLLISMHKTGRDVFDFVYYIPLPDNAGMSMVQDIIAGFEKDKSIYKKNRVYQKLIINELVKDDKTFTYLIHSNYLFNSN